MTISNQCNVCSGVVLTTYVFAGNGAGVDAEVKRNIFALDMRELGPDGATHGQMPWKIGPAVRGVNTEKLTLMIYPLSCGSLLYTWESKFRQEQHRCKTGPI